MDKIKTYLYIQSLILLGGTLFAWFQWFQEYFGGCSACSTEKEFFSKCFFGALFFTGAFLLNLMIIYTVFNENNKK